LEDLVTYVMPISSYVYEVGAEGEEEGEGGPRKALKAFVLEARMFALQHQYHLLPRRLDEAKIPMLASFPCMMLLSCHYKWY